ncbi:hypothetical protein EPN81_03260 [Patescibacteria group bacterium]|nr:MAG: hypothetical protein EPN81_03260 [Patescibacteria group bacterium]
MEELTKEEVKILKSLIRPRRVQDFLDTIPINFEEEGDTVLSPRRVLREHRAHCIEGALLAACAFALQGRRPLLLDLTSAHHDDDHVVALFQEQGRWGAVSKTNHAVLRYREPVYRTVGELAMSYFHEYFLHDGRKTLRSYSRPVDLSRFHRGWMVEEENLWYIVDALNNAPHTDILRPGQGNALRRADAIEIDAGKLTQWKQTKTP